MSDLDIVKQFLANQTHMVVSVMLDDGNPWAVPVRIGRYEGREFEWDSAVDTLHSQAIARDPRVMLLCYDRDQMIGVYMQAIVTDIDQYKDGYAHYRAIVDQAWLNDQTFTKREIEL